METKEAKKAPRVKKERPKEERLKSKTTLFWEKYPNGILRIMDMKAVLK